MLLLTQAIRCSEDKNWVLGESLATEAIHHEIMVQTAHMVRARARRFQRKFDESISDYTEALQMDPDNPDALMYRGATYMDLSSCREDYQQSMQIISNSALPDFQRASFLDPGHLGIELSILEVQLCLTNYRGAIATGGVCWTRASWTGHKIVCAWLGTIALILAGKAGHKWRHYEDFLQAAPGRLDGYWNEYSVERLLKHLETMNFDRARLDLCQEIHALFLARHGPNG